jgi:hypothetical protein
MSEAAKPIAEQLAPYFENLKNTIETYGKIQAEHLKEVQKQLVILTRRVEELKTAVADAKPKSKFK